MKIQYSKVGGVLEGGLQPARGFSPASLTYASPTQYQRIVPKQGSKPGPDLVQAAIDGVGSPTGRARLGASKVLRDLSGQSPDLIYPHFDFFAGLLGSPNHILKWNATLTLASLATVDRDGRLDQIMDAYLAPISGPNMIDAANAIRGAAVIALAKPYLAPGIAARILAVERASYATAECRNVAIGHAIRAFDQIFDAAGGQREVLRFVNRQTENPRPATRAKARRFLRKRSSGAGTA